MSRPSPLLQGFDYASHAPVTLTARDWRARYAGHRRTVENGETLYHSPRVQTRDGWLESRIVAEVYGRVPE